ncbi:MAG: lipid A deacylase LpxR family protein [Wenzhouxiangellaceae bacterium]
MSAFHSCRRRIPALVLICLAATSAGNAAAQVWRAGWANDEFLGSDNQFTNGIFVQKSSALADSLEATGGTPAFGKSLAAWLLPARNDLHYRETWTIAQNMQTPDEISRREVILDDVPYVGMLGWANAFIAFNDDELTGFQTLLGWVGDLTLAEEAQSAAHKVTGATSPNGWRNQLDNEPLLNIYAMRKQKFYRNNWMDAAWNVDAALGNFFTHGQAALEFRFGNFPAGFAPAPTPTGRNIDYDARIRAPGESYFYASTIVRATGLLFAIPRHGNLLRNNNQWTENERIDPENLIGQIVLGLHYERPRWGLHFTINLATDSVDPEDGGSQLKDPSNNFGILIAEWKF